MKDSQSPISGSERSLSEVNISGTVTLTLHLPLARWEEIEKFGKKCGWNGGVKFLEHHLRYNDEF